jgi:hypothetical protein
MPILPASAPFGRAHRGHGVETLAGTCAYCGTDVRPGYNLCPACGATWGRNLRATRYVVQGAILTITVLGAFIGLPLLIGGLIGSLVEPQWWPPGFG